jgi:hypothetical protein
MEPDQIDHLDLYVLIKAWVRPRLSWFPRWTFDDIVHEAYLIAIKKLADFDPTMGTICTFLTPRLFDPVWTKYMHHEGYRIDRNKVAGKWMRRKCVRVVMSVGRVPDQVYEPEVKEPLTIPPFLLGLAAQDTVPLVMRGLSAAQIARARGVSESAISQVITRLRREWPKTSQDGF